MPIIDADGHIFEPEAMFKDLSQEFYPRRPIPVFLPSDTERGDRNGCWIIEGKTYPTIGGKGRNTFDIPGSEKMKKRSVTLESATLADVDARLADLDRLNINIQVVFPTMFLVSAAEDVKLEGALFQAYNNYLSRACAKSKGRIKWVALIPFRDPDAAVKEIRRAGEMGASGIFTMGMVWDRPLTEPDFFPIYEESASLDLPVCVHLGWSTPQVTDLFANGNFFFCSATVPVMWGFVLTMGAGLLTRFPKLRLGFFETGASWVPYAIQQLRRLLGGVGAVKDGQSSTSRGFTDIGIDPQLYRDPAELLKSGRAFVNCEGDEDFRYLFEHLGEDSLMCSSDFPHEDASSEASYVTNWRRRVDVSDQVKEKLLGENAARFFHL